MAWTREQERAYQRAYNIKNREKIRRYGKSASLQRKYGITIEQWERLIQSQDGKCGICCSALDRGPHTHLDHAHASGQVRAVLCRDCNHLIGNAKENPELLERAAMYVRVWQWIDSLNEEAKALA